VTNWTYSTVVVSEFRVAKLFNFWNSAVCLKEDRKRTATRMRVKLHELCIRTENLLFPSKGSLIISVTVLRKWVSWDSRKANQAQCLESINYNKRICTNILSHFSHGVRTFCRQPKIGIVCIGIFYFTHINPLNPKLNHICYLLALLGPHYFLHVSRIRVKLLTFRILMSSIYMGHSFLMFLDHTQRRSTVGRTPLDEWSARHRDLYLITHDIHNRQISMPPVEFEPKISAGERLCDERPLWRADHSSRAVLPNVLRRCVWSRNIKNWCSIYMTLVA